VNKDRVPKIVILAIIQDEYKYKNRKEDNIYKKVWRVNERK